MNKTGQKAKNPFAFILTEQGNLARMLIIMAVIFVLMSILRPEQFPTVKNISSMAFQFPEFGMLCIAMALTMITGGNDLAIVAEANLSSIIAALIMTSNITAETDAAAAGGYIALAILAAMGVGLLCGMLNGLLISKIGISPILTTLGTMQIYTGISVVITQGAAVVGFPESFANLGTGSVAGIPAPLIIFIIVVAVVSWLLRSTKFGLQVFMFGSNPKAARFSGINNDRIQTLVYMMAGLLASVAGIIIMSRTNSAKADYGSSYILQTILVSVMGGVNPKGGKGSLITIVVAVITLQFISSGFNMLRLSSYFKDLVYGGLLVGMLIINYFVEKRQDRAVKAAPQS